LTLNTTLSESARTSISNVLSTQSKYWSVLRQFQKRLPANVNIVVSAKYGTEEERVVKQLENLHLLSNSSTEDSVNANSILPIIPDPPPASGEPSSSIPSPPPPVGNNNFTNRAVVPDATQVTIGGGENTTVTAQRRPGVNPDANEVLEGAVGGANNNNPLTVQDAYRIMVNQNVDITQGGARMFVVSPLSWCPHIETINAPSDTLNAGDPCRDCNSTAENWICLTCYEVFCSRYVREHMAQHSIESGHQVTMSFSDLSVWCYACNDYVDCPALNAAKSAAYRSKFGENMPGASNSL